MKEITLYPTVYAKDNPFYKDIGIALQRIRQGKSRELIEKIRSSKDPKERAKLKTQLPCVLFSGVFTLRKDSAMVSHSGFICLDFDHIDVATVKPIIAMDDHVYACWVSPSGDGLKALVQITNPERHRDHFNALAKYFDKKYSLLPDISGKNESRACFESYDPEIVINETSEKFSSFFIEEVHEREAPKPEAPKKDLVYTDYVKLNLVAKMIQNAVDGDKHNQLLRAARLCGGYIAAGRMEEAEAIHVLEREIMKRDINSIETAKETIRTGIEYGKTLPVREIIDLEKDSKRKLQLDDDDYSFISNDSDDFKWIEDYAEGRVEVGLGTGVDAFDEYFRYKKEFLILNGHSNVGKTTFCLYLIVNSVIRHGWKWCIYSSENTTATLKMKLMEFAVNRPISEMTYPQRKASYEWVKKNFIIYANRDMYSYTDILTFTEHCMKRDRIDALFIDPYNSLKIQIGNNNKIGVHEYHYEAASELLNFANNNQIAVWLNTHAVTEAQRRKDSEGLPIAPYAEDSEHGGKWVNRCSGFLTIHRKVQAENPEVRRTTELHVRKVRMVETGGQPTPLNSPLEFTLNTKKCGFYLVKNGKTFDLFDPISNSFEDYKIYDVPKLNMEDGINIEDVF